MAATAAIFHHPDVIESAERPLAGRRTAGQSFLGGYVRHVEADKLHCFAANEGTIQQFRDLVTGHGWTGPVEGYLQTQPGRFSDPGVIQVPGPSLASFAWTRRRAGQRHYSICGITHTVSTRRIMEGLLEGLSAPVEAWDAIICTSRAVQGVVAAELDEAERYLAQRFQARRVPRPKLPVIPLGIDTAQFAANPEDRSRWRAEFSIPDDAIAVMTMGRLTFAEKLHPAPLLIALQKAAERSGKKFVLLMVGWFGDEATEKLHRDMADAFAPDVDVHFPDGKDEDLRYSIWSAADIFTLPVDNIQETFGLAPVEAMAAGLPVVCSDWNGFKDTIEDGVTGIRVRTIMAPPGAGQALANRLEDMQDSYLQYLTSVHQRTSVDVPEMADAFATLANDPEKRAEMGAAGRERAARLYDWSAIIPQYQALWAELNAIRTREVPASPRPPDAPANPTAMDPFTLYRGYPTTTLTPASVVSAAVPVTQERIEEIMELTGAVAMKRMITRSADVAKIQNAIHEHGPIRLADLEKGVKAPDHVLVSTVLWLAKFDLVEVAT